MGDVPDIVTLLRHPERYLLRGDQRARLHPINEDVMKHAADEIEKLRGERDALRAERDELGRNYRRRGAYIRWQRWVHGKDLARLAATPQPPADDDQGGDQ